MKNNLYIDGVHYLTAREAGDVLGYAPDYVSRLCREGKLRGRRTGKTWIVEADSLVPFIKAHEAKKEAWHQNLSRELKSVAEPVVVRDENFQPLSPVHVAPRQLHILRASEKAHAAREKAQTMLITRITISSICAVLLLFIANTTALSTPIANMLRGSAAEQVAAASFFSPIESIARASYTSITSIACSITGWCDDVQPMPVVYVRGGSQPVAQAPAPTQITNNITNYIQPMVGSGGVLASGVSEQLLDSRLNAMENYLTGRIELAEYRGDRQAESIVDSFPDGIGGAGFDDIDITDSTFTGGSISGASISGSTLSGITFSGAQAFDALEVTDATSTNATSTNMYVSGSFGFGTGTGILQTTDGIASTLANGSNGQVLKMVGGNLAWSTDLTGGGGGGASFFASTTDDLAIYPADPTDVVIIGSSATTTVGTILEIAGNSLFRGAMTSYGNVTAPRFTATSSAASVFPYASTTALSTNSLCISGDCRQAWPTFTDTSFSTTSADYWKTQRDFFSTTSASYFLSQNQGTAFSTTSADYLLSTYNKGFFFSTTSAQYFLTQNGSLGFSTTSNDYWMTQRNFFSTTSADAWKDQRNFFSTSSASYFASIGLAFSTTSNDYWKSVNNFFSTTSADYWGSTKGYATFSYLFPSNATSTRLDFNAGLTAYASSTIGGGTRTSGLTISGGATTTGTAYFAGNVGIGTSSPVSPLSVVYSDSSFNRGITVRNTNTGTQAISGIRLQDSNGTDKGIFDYLASNYQNAAIANTVLFGTVDNTKLGFIGGTGSGNPDIYFQSGANNAPTLYIQGSSQNVGIGTTSPYGKLSVVGNVVAARFVATTSTASVFPYASTTALSAATLCLTGDSCISAWPTFTDTSFSTTSADYWKTQRDFFSTTSASHFLSQNQSLGFSTTSANYFVSSSTTIPKTYSANTFTALQTFGNASSSIFSANTICLSTDCRTSWPTAGSSFEYPFFGTGNSTSTLVQFNGGLTAYASSTIGNGSAAGGLTVNGTATTSRLVVSGTGTSTFAGDILMGGSIIPSLDNTYSLGSESRMWKDVYIGPGSLYVNGKKVIEDVSNTITISTDNDQNLMSETSGVGNNTMRATGSGNLNLLSASGNINVTSTSGNINIGTSGSGQLNLGIIASGTWQGTLIADAYLTKSGNWTGTLDGYEAAQLLGSGFSTTSADYWKDQRNFFSTSSADYWGSTKGYVTFGYLFPGNATTTNLDFQNGLTISSGSLGIGTSSPGALMDLGDAVSSSKLLLYNTGSNQYGFGINPGELNVFAGTGGSINFRTGGAAGTSNLLIKSDGDLIMDTSGSVGIGTNDPSLGATVDSKLTIIQSPDATALAAATSTAAKGFALNVGPNGGLSIFDGGINGTSWTRGLTQVGGKVGIGTTNPFAALSLGNDITQQKLAIFDGGTGGSFYGFGLRSARLDFQTEGTTRLTIDNTGNVGIGALDPITPLDMHLGSDVNFRVRDNGGTEIYAANDANSAYTPLTIQGTTLLINPATEGSVGIGTSSPTSKLSVYGNILLEGSNRTINFGTIGGDYGLRDNAGSLEFKNLSGSWNALVSSINHLSDAKYDGSSLFLGDYSGNSDDGSNSNTGIGTNALFSNTSGQNNTALGFVPLYNNLTGSDNIALGYQPLYNNTSGSQNIGIGRQALLNNDDGGSNIGIGTSALSANVSGTANITVGGSAMSNYVGGNYNTALGYFAGRGATGASGNDNVFIGASSGESMTSGGSNVFLGTRAGDGVSSGNYNIAIGAGVGIPDLTSSGQLNIGSVLFGTGLWDQAGTTSAATADGRIGIGSTTPGSILSIGTTNGINFSTATSTFSSTGGINLTDGCYAIDGICISGSSSGASFAYPFPNNATTTILAFNGGLLAVGSTTINGNATTTGMLGIGSLFFNGEQFLDFTGAGLLNNSGFLTLDTSGSWSGTFDGLEGSAYLANSFSTTSANYWQTQRNFFSTTSADYWETQQTSRLADNLTDNILEDLSNVAVMTESLGDLFYWSGSEWSNIATSSLGLPTFSDLSGFASFGYLFPSNGTSTLLNFNGGVTAYASSTIGAGGQATGLTINGGATTTGVLNVTGTGTSTISGNLDVVGALKVGNNSLYLTSTSIQNLTGNLLLQQGSGNVGIGTTTPQWQFTIASTTGAQLSLSAGAGINQWAFRNAGGDLFFSTTTIAGTATTSTAALSIAGSGFGTTTVRGLNINGQATSTSNVGFNITAGCYAMNGVCLSAGSTSLTGTQGQVAYFSGTNTAVGTSSLFIASNGNVGVGTTSPTGPGSAGANLKIARTTNNWGMVIEGVGSNQSDLLFHTPGNTADRRILQLVNNQDKFTIRSLTDAIGVSQNLFVGDLSTGHVGIGTTTPNARLTVYGDTLFNGTDRYANFGTTTGTSGYGFRDNGGVMEFKNANGTWQGVTTATTGPSFSVHKNGSDQTIAAGGDVLVTWSTETFDTNNNFASNRFTPTVPGKYLIRAQAWWANTIDAGGNASIMIYKNGSVFAQVYNYPDVASAQRLTSAISEIIDMNGSTDYIEIYVSHASAGSEVVEGTATLTNFSGTMIAPINGNNAAGWANDGSASFLLDNADNLGIGTTSPAWKLAVVGSGSFDGFARASFFIATSTTASTFSYASTTAITSSTASTTNLVVSGLQNGLLKVGADGAVSLAVLGTDYQKFAYLFPSNATSTLLAFNGGLTAYASSTIGAGSQTTGLTINGGATTTGNAYFGGNVGIGTTSPGSVLSIGSIANFQAGTSTLYQNLNVQGQLKVGTNSIYLNGSGTSTFSNGIDLAGGCFSILNTCVLSASASGLVAGDLTTAINSSVNALQIASSSAKWVSLSNGVADSFGSASVADTAGIDLANSSGIATSAGMIVLVPNAAPSGGNSSSSGGDTIHTFTSNGTFYSGAVGTVQVLVVGGGGGGGSNVTASVRGSGGGGAGEYIAINSFNVTPATSYAITVGIGGSSNTNGATTTAFGLTARGGGAGAEPFNNGSPGGSGGGAGDDSSAKTGGASTAISPGVGFSGGNALSGGSGGGGAGGGGAAGTGGAGGGNGVEAGGAGGTGIANTISGASVTYSTGGAGGTRSGNNNGTDGAAPGSGGRGAGGGASAVVTGGAGADGIVIVRYTTSGTGASRLISNTFTASTSPSAAKFFFAGTSTAAFTLNSDIAAAVSRDGGTSWSTTTLKVLSTLEDGSTLYGDTAVDLSGQPVGTSMKYRILISPSSPAGIMLRGVSLQWGEASAQNAGALSVTGSLSAQSLSLTSALGVVNGGTGLTSINSGSILFGNGIGAIGTSSALFWDTTSDRLGIGTTSPNYKLHIDGGDQSPWMQFTDNNAGSSINDGLLLGYDTSGAYLIQRENLPLIFRTSNSNRMTITGGGNVGIGTTTPISTLSVQGSLCVRSTGSCGTTAGTIYATTAAISDIDLAENYRAVDSTLMAGEIVSLLEGSTSTIRRAKQGEEGLGVLSTKPGLLLGQEIKDGRAVALKGRVPLKVNMEGGPIVVGDRLTISSVPGVGTKATTSAYTVARALESTSTDGEIEVFVENEYTLVIEERNALRDLLNTTSTATSTPIFVNIFARMTEWLAHAGNGITEIFTKTLRAENVYADTVNANKLCLEDLCVTKAELQQLLNQSGATPASTPEEPPDEPQSETPPEETGSEEPAPEPEDSPETEAPEDAPEESETPPNDENPEPESTPEPSPEEV